MEASAIPATVGLARTRIAVGAPLLRIRSDEQLVSLFRGGSDEAFRAIHDRYRQRLFAYTRQMLAGSAADAEDMVQEIFVRAYAGLRASNRELALRAWLYRIAHNRCIDELRRPQAVPTEEIAASFSGSGHDPVVRLEQRDALRRLIDDVRRLPAQQRSALLMRELGGMTYADVSGALGISVPAVKSLLVRARVGLARASEARDTECARIREDLMVAHDRGVRTSGLARRHMRDCESCRQFRVEVRGVSRQLAAFSPALGPVGVVAKLLGIGGAGGGGAWAMAGGGAAAGTGAAASAGAVAGAGHVATLLAAAVVTAGGAIELQHIVPVAAHHPAHHRVVTPRPSTPALYPHTAAPVPEPVAPQGPTASAAATATRSAGIGSGTSAGVASPPAADPDIAARRSAATGSSALGSTVPLTQIVDPDTLSYPVMLPPGVPTLNPPQSGSPGSTGTAATSSTAGDTAGGSGNPAGTGTSTSTGTGTGVGAGTGTSTGTSGAGGPATASGTTPSSGAAAAAGPAPASSSSAGTGSAPATATGSSATAAGTGTAAGGGASTSSATPPAQTSSAATSGTATRSASATAPARSTTSPARARPSTPRRSSTAGARTHGSRHRARVLGAAFTITGS